MTRYTDTIYALATPPGKSGVAVIRLSGARSLDILHSLAPGLQKRLAEDGEIVPRQTYLAKLYTPVDMLINAHIPVSGQGNSGQERVLIDEALAVYFKAPHSFTGEDVVELHLHGSVAIIRLMMEVLGQYPGLRLAEPGEFSRRAFDNQKMDLTEAEGLADLIEAETHAQHRQAMRQMQGELQAVYETWRQEVIELLAYIEAYIDFPDEDLPEALVKQVTEKVAELEASLLEHLDDNRRGEKLRVGVQAVIVGPPNVGKSTLLNHLTRRDVAIVSEYAGTTRDIIETHLDIKGYPLVIADTAGIRNTDEHVEQEGIRRALLRAEQADLVIVMLDPSHLEGFEALVSEAPVQGGSSYRDKEGEQGAYLYDIYRIIKTTPYLVIVNKWDNGVEKGDVAIRYPSLAAYHPIYISLKAMDGVDDMLGKLGKMVELQCGITASPMITRARHRAYIQEAVGHIQRFSLDKPIELVAEDLRLAARNLGKVTGHIDIEDILDALFSQFCIGK